CCFFFFFSSRRRHTRSYGDWSSDVCSSDLKVTVFGSARTRKFEPAYEQAVRFGRAMAENHWLVVTGAASGIMEAGHLGAGRENRSEERRVGKECRSRWAREH